MSRTDEKNKNIRFFCKNVIFHPTEVRVKQDMISPAEMHDKCNPKDLDSELKCDLIDRYLTCRPFNCGTGDRFRCDCSVYE